MRSSFLLKEAKRHIPSGVNSPVRAFRSVGGTPVFMERGRGPFIYDVEGRRYLDFCLSWGPLIFGHSPRGLVQALQKEIKRGTSFGAPTSREVEVAGLIKQAFPSIEKVRLVSSGTEAVMSAIRLARGVTGRKKILKIEGGYHGHVDSLLIKAGSGGATFGVPDSLGVPGELARLTLAVPFNDFEALRRVFKREGKNLAAFILEPVPANMGVVLPKPGYLEEARRMSGKFGTVLIFDEVITGFRLAFGGAQERFGIKADLTCLGKVLGGGLPLAAFGGRSELMDELAPEGGVYQAGTLSGNPVACASALWMLRKLSKGDSPLKRGQSPQKGTGEYGLLERRAGVFYEELRNRIKHFHWALQLNALGSLFTLFFNAHPVLDFRGAKRSHLKHYAQFFHKVLDGGVYLAPSQFEANFISTVHTEKDLLKTLHLFERVLRKIF